MKLPEGIYFHPIFVHFPQALFPVAFAAFLLYGATGVRDFEVGAFLMAAAGAAAAPVTTLTGLLDWKIRYKGYMTSVFRIKIVGAFVLIALSIPAVLLRLLSADVAALPLSGLGFAYAGLLAACAGTCVVLGHYGGKLVFH
ncbi:MAG: hypothetical protein M0Z38_00045 [Deltaproteobacteria bacterium]|nr:hypothetical protein [Deltaproteobacteria bacterium]